MLEPGNEDGRPSTSGEWLAFVALLVVAVISVAVAAVSVVSVLGVLFAELDTPFGIPLFWLVLSGVVSVSFNIWFSNKHHWFFDAMPDWLGRS